jgi:hypothetical protein
MVEWIPVLAPAVEHLAAVDEDLEITRSVQPEPVQPSRLRNDGSFPGHMQAVDGALHVGLARSGRPAVHVLEILELDGRLAAPGDGLAVDSVGRGPACAAVDLQPVAGRPGIGVGLRIAEAGDRIIVPQQPVVARRNQERDRDVHVVLRQQDVLAVVVHLPVLVLAEAVEALVRAAVELLRNGEPGLSFGASGRE